MLSQLLIQNFAIIRRLELDFASGMTVLTGETGAGKSIAIDALGLALGGRGDGSWVRAGAAQLEVSARFELRPLSAASRWLASQELTADGECILRRVVSAEGRSKGYINGRAVPLANLRELGELLVEIHGQHEHQRLMRSDAQRELLDSYAGHDAELDAVRQTWLTQRRLDDEWQALETGRQARAARLELLRYQVEELQAAHVQTGEAEAIQEEHKRLAHGSELMLQARAALDLVYENDELSAFRLLSRAADTLAKLRQLDERLTPIATLLEESAIQVREAAHDLNHYLDHLELDPERMTELDTRLTELTALARKHRITPDELPALTEQLSAELNSLSGSDDRHHALQSERDQARAAYQAAAERLSASRQQAAAKLAPLISAHLDSLAIRGGRFEVALIKAEQASGTGLEKAEFRVVTNAGQPAQPLAKIASGGELSRISLAIQVVIAEKGQTPTLIFDEVDVGIGGGTAEIVGRLLRQLGHNTQILCVTHQAQVAAQGHQHLQVQKAPVDGATETRIIELDAEARVQELARMLGGLKITDATLEHAREMLLGETA